MKKIISLKSIVLLLVGFFVTLPVLATEKRLNTEEIQNRAETACRKSMYQLYLDYTDGSNPTVISKEAQGDGDAEEFDAFGFKKKPNALVLGYWLDGVDGPVPTDKLSDTNVVHFAKNKSYKQLFTALQVGIKADSNTFLCPDPEHAPEDAYADAQGNVLMKYACRQNLLILLGEAGCGKIALADGDHRKSEKNEVYAKDRAQKNAAFEAFETAVTTVISTKAPNFEAVEDSAKDGPKEQMVATAGTLWTNYKTTVEAAAEAIQQWKEALQDKNESDQTALKLEGQYLFDLAASHYKAVKESIDDFNNHRLENSFLEENLEAIEGSVLDSATEARTLFENQKQELDAITEKFSVTGNALRYKQKYLQGRINDLAFSSITKGVSSFNVSNTLVTKNTEEEGISAEGRWTLFDDDEGNGRENFFNKIIKLVTGVVGTLGVIILIIAIVMLVTANGDDTQIGKAKELILYALVGLFVIFISYIVIQFVIDLLAW